MYNEDNNHKSKWSIEYEKILIDLADKAMCYRWLHSRSNAYYHFLNTIYTIPVIIISTLTGTANFAQQRVPVEYQAIFFMVVGGFNIFAGIMSTIQQFLKITQLDESHRISCILWDKFYRNVKIEIAKHPDERMNVDDFIKIAKEEFDRLMETSPSIPLSIIKEFKSKFKNTDDYNTISKPEICDILIATEKFKNPWLNVENVAMRDNKTHKLLHDEKQKTYDINKAKVTDFINMFYYVNNRKPTDDEIIDNLKDKISMDVLTKLIEECNNKDDMNC